MICRTADRVSGYPRAPQASWSTARPPPRAPSGSPLSLSTVHIPTVSAISCSESSFMQLGQPAIITGSSSAASSAAILSLTSPYISPLPAQCAIAPQQPSISATPPFSRVQRSSYAAITASGAIAAAWQPGKNTYLQWLCPGCFLQRYASPLEKSISNSANSWAASGILSVSTMFSRAVLHTWAISNPWGQVTVHCPHSAQAFIALLSGWSPIIICVLLYISRLSRPGCLLKRRR